MKFKLYFTPVIIEAKDEQEANEMCSIGEFETPYVDLIEEVKYAKRKPKKI